MSYSNTCDLESAWTISFEDYEPEEEGHRESLCALGNGYFVTRAAAFEATADCIHYPGTYRAGIYNRLVSHIEGEDVDDESIVNLPNWLLLTFRIEGGDWFSIDNVEILSYHQKLHLRHGVLQREIQFRDSLGRQTLLREQRFVSMALPHLAGLNVELIAENWSGNLEIHSAIDGRVINNNVDRQKEYSKQHLEPLETGTLEPEGIWLKMRTCQSHINIALAARTRVFVNGNATDSVRVYDCEEAQVVERIHLSVKRGSAIAIEKIAALYTSHDYAIGESGEAAQQAIQDAPSFVSLLDAHKRAWALLWMRCEIDIAPVEYLRAIRLHIFHILQTVSPHTTDIDVGVSARGWHGENYRGHIFWDETFVLSFLAPRFPTVARSILLYRYRRLNFSRHLARQHGYSGAMFPWRSASTGREETPRFQFNPLSEHWIRDKTCLQHHINAIIAFNVWKYYTVTNDITFLCDYGAELIIEIARFWASIVTYNPKCDRYEILSVVGSDEYHTAYPNTEIPGIDNNTYTNVMASWTLCCAREVLNILPPSPCAELCYRLKLSQDEIEHWNVISQKMHIDFHNDGILSQYEGFENLSEFDLQQFHEQHGSQRVDWVLEAEGDDINRYQVTKQADVAMLFFLLTEKEVTVLLERQGYQFNRKQMQRTIEYHLQRTAHQSTLSRIVYAGALATLDSDKSWQLFAKACFTEISDKDSKETIGGIHLGMMAGTLYILHYHYLGLRIQNGSIYLDPSLPTHLKRLSISLHHRSNDLQIEMIDNHLSISAASANTESVKVTCQGQTMDLQPDTSVAINLAHTKLLA
ncbi:glycoside hydrolase family 65 protein [Scytonema sp. NUACC26]|uniref:glycoside hydrolase family 65 protein n=1 Tax=Scytonema sp. NUACC26 TaxID=3140176 RepID=UPI0034DC7B45